MELMSSIGALRNTRDPPPSSWQKTIFLINHKIWVSTCSPERAETDYQGLQALFLNAGVSQCDVGRRVGMM